MTIIIVIIAIDDYNFRGNDHDGLGLYTDDLLHEFDQTAKFIVYTKWNALWLTALIIISPFIYMVVSLRIAVPNAKFYLYDFKCLEKSIAD